MIIRNLVFIGNGGKVMKLYDYMELVKKGTEVTVFDKEYDMETYFYGGKNTDDEWEKLLQDLFKKLTIERIGRNGVTVNLSDVIEKNLDNLIKADLFVDNDIECIMMSIGDILAGNISMGWMKKFVECLQVIPCKSSDETDRMENDVND